MCIILLSIALLISLFTLWCINRLDSQWEIVAENCREKLENMERMKEFEYSLEQQNGDKNNG